MLCQRHRWTWKDVQRCRWLVTPTGTWRPMTAGTIELKQITAIPVTRYRYRAGNIPSAGFPAGTAESLLRREAHGGFGERHGETGQEQSSHRALGRLSEPGPW
jgi:hypothetical protein